MTALAPVLQAFFTDRLVAQRRASPHTIAGYRTTFRLLVRFAAAATGKTPSALDIADLDAPLITAFLDHLEADRRNTVRTRNWRLAAIRSLFGYAALSHPEHAATIQRVLAIPAKRHDRRAVTWLTDAEVDALLAAPDRRTWAGRRDHAMFVLAVQTGLRISELIDLSRSDIVLGRGAHVRCMGKGRKEQATPLTRLTVAVLREWLAERGGQPRDPLFPTRTGTRLSHDAIEDRLASYLEAARTSCPSLRTKHVTMHTLRHTAAMRFQGRGVASDATFRVWREGCVAGAAALPCGRRAGGRSAGHAVDQGFLAAGCGGCQDVASDSVALDDRWLHLALRVRGRYEGSAGAAGAGGCRWRGAGSARCRAAGGDAGRVAPPAAGASADGPADR